MLSVLKNKVFMNELETKSFFYLGHMHLNPGVISVNYAA